MILYFPEHSDLISCPIEGSPLYLAPEIVTRQPIGREVDIWACAVIFYTMLVSEKWVARGLLSVKRYLFQCAVEIFQS